MKLQYTSPNKVLLLVVFSGILMNLLACSAQSPTRINIKPGETEIETDRTYKGPTRSTLRATVQMPDAVRAPAPVQTMKSTVQLRVSLPKQEKENE